MGAYLQDQDWDVCRDRPAKDGRERIETMSAPEQDPVIGEPFGFPSEDAHLGAFRDGSPNERRRKSLSVSRVAQIEPLAIGETGARQLDTRAGADDAVLYDPEARMAGPDGFQQGPESCGKVPVHRWHDPLR